MRRWVLVLVLTCATCLAAALGVLPSSPALADGRLGEDWEAGIEDGIERQERERKQRPPEALLRQAKLLAGRRAEGSVQIVRLYLLARAYGIAGDAASARETYADLLKLEPRVYHAYHDLAMIALQDEPEDARAAERHLRDAIGINPRFLTAQR